MRVTTTLMLESIYNCIEHWWDLGDASIGIVGSTVHSLMHACMHSKAHVST